MLDQSFSAENFRKIFDYENRKGNYLAGSFFPDANEKSRKIKRCNDELKELKKPSDEDKVDAYTQKKQELVEKKTNLEQEKEQILEDAFKKVSDTATQKNFSLDLEDRDINGKKVYVAANSSGDYSGLAKEKRLNLAAQFFALKQTQKNISKLYKVKQADRYNIVCQLREALRGRFPKYIIRTDISSFYESIPRVELIKKINEDNLLTYNSKKTIKQILYKYGTLPGGSFKGIPRGVGISAYLSELHMRELDEEMRNAPNVLYYARYVDDIIIIYTNANPSVKSLRAFCRNIIEKGLKRNRQKTSLIKANGSTPHTIDYLGYSFRFGTGDVKVNITKSKVDRYKSKIDLSFYDYEKKLKYNEKKARRLLIKRIKFLTGNTRLIGNKKNIRVGIYFSNKILTDHSYLKGMDCYLTHKVSSLQNERAKNRLSKLSFQKGFVEKTFYKFSKADLENIMEAWKYA